MKAYALSALSVTAVIGLVIATPMLSRAAGFGAAAGVSKSLAPSVDLAGCAVSIDPEHKIWLASACGGTSSGGGGNSSSSSSSSSGTSSSSSSSSGTSGGSGGGPGGRPQPGRGY